MENSRQQSVALANQQQAAGKKRKYGSRDSVGPVGSDAMDMRMAMGMAMDMGLAGEEEAEDLLSMTDEQMVSMRTVIMDVR
jgi:hypothetical protein